MSEKIKFKAKIEYVVYFKDTFGVVSVSTTENIPFSKVREEYDFITNEKSTIYTTTITGKMSEPKVGQTWDIEGHHAFHKKYKDQYLIDSIGFSTPTTVEDTKAYLESILTYKQAETLLSVYPSIVNDVIAGKDEYVDLNLLSGFGQITYDKCKEKILENFAISDIISLLIPIGISFNKLKKLLNDEPNPQILKEKLINNPYILTKISGISFKVADQIATQLNPSLRESEERLISFLDYYFEKVASDKGHTWISSDDVKSAILSEVPEVEKFVEELFKKEIENPNHLFIDGEKVGLKKLHDAEMFIWEKAIELSNTVPLPVSQEDIDEGIKIAEGLQGFEFTEEQKEVIVNMTKNNFCLEVGKSGTGKTTTARGLLNIYKHAGYSVIVAAFSAKASKRAMQATGFDGSTLHRLLGIGQEYTKSSHSNEEQVEFDVLFVDENSMNPLFLMKEIFKLVGGKPIKIILCGDNKQIVPLGIGNVFSDLLEKDIFNKNVLTKIQRQAAKSGMILDGNLIRDGIDPIEKKEARITHGENKDLIWLFKGDKDEIFRIAIASYLKSVKDKGVGNSVLLVPFKTKGLNCTRNFNKTIQAELNSENKDIKFVHGDLEFWLNDYVINVKNNYDKNIMNGSLGFVRVVEATKIVVDFEGQMVEYGHEDILELELAHSLSTHKFQGSESLDAIVVMDSSHFVLLNNGWLYTSLTRARERCLVITDEFAYNRCMKEDATERDTWLKMKEFDADTDIKLPVEVFRDFVSEDLEDEIPF